jgi:hypothetical protein
MRSPPQSLEDRIEDERQRAYHNVCPMQMNREERRTNRGRLIVAAATMAADEAEQRYRKLMCMEEE